MIHLVNNFHGTRAAVRPIEEDGRYYISIATYRRVQRKLCGIKGCLCGGVRGGRYTLRHVPGYWAGTGYVEVIDND